MQVSPHSPSTGEKEKAGPCGFWLGNEMPLPSSAKAAENTVGGCFMKSVGKGALRGQSMLESALVMVMVSLVFFGMLQVVLKLNAEQVQQWAAFGAARSRIVGLNDAVVEKVWLVGNILNSGKMLAPEQGLSAVAQVDDWESTRIPEFLNQAGTAWELAPWLNYEQWEHLPRPPPATAADAYQVQVQQDYPLILAQMLPFLAGSFGTTNAVLQSDVTLENHFPLYFQFN